MTLRHALAARLLPPLRAALAPPGVLLLPVLMLPLLAAGIWLAVDPPTRPLPARLLTAAGAAVLAWYMLGGTMTLGRFHAARGARRALARGEAELAALPGQVWACDGAGLVLWQNAAAGAAHGDHLGRPLAHALARIAADPVALQRSLLARAPGRPQVEAEAGLGRLRLRPQAGGALQVWQYLPPGDPVAERPAKPPTVLRPAAGDTLFELLPAALLSIGPDGRIRGANAAAGRILGGVPEGATLATLLDGLGRPVDDWVDDVLQRRTEARPEILHRRRRPELHLQVALAHDAQGGLLAMLTDASAMKTLEAQFVQSQKMQAIGHLAGGIAHDFNNLLTAIGGHCDLLMLRHEKTDPDYADLDQIGQNANRAAALVGQLLAFSRKQTLNPQLMDLRDTLADLTHLLNRLVGERVVLDLEHDPELHPIRADRRQVEQVIVNLVVNARDAMQHGGRITIRTSNLARGARPRPRRLPEGDWVTVEVSDEGCGIPPDRLDKIFEPFFTTKRAGEGTGLGLSTVYGIVKQTGGYVFCDSAPGQGTTFALHFPAHDPARLAEAQAATEVAPTPAPAVAPAVPGGRVLLVEDEAAVRAFAARALAMRGFEVIEAASAEHALDLLAGREDAFDVFVTDVVMPGMDGPSWVRRALRDRPNTRVLFISGYSEDVFEDGRTPVPGAAFLQKPFSLASLADTVAGLAGADGGARPQREA